jgi:alpha-beta hydrolase superfamily lysophospholipase
MTRTGSAPAPAPSETIVPPGLPSAAAAATTVPPIPGSRQMPDATLLRTLHWPAVGEPWAMALVVHGLGEHGGRYGIVAEALTRDGIDVHAYDQRGFGGSAGERAYVDRWSRLHDDLQIVLVGLRDDRPGLPLILYGHSMGGLVAAGYVLSAAPRPLPDLLVLSSPGLDSSFPGWKRSMAAVLAPVMPHARLSNGPLRDGLSHDPAIREAYARDPLCQTTSTVRFGHEGFVEQARVRAAIEALDAMPVPTYVFHGSGDPVVPVTASVVLGTKGGVTRHVHEGLRHETHHEPEHEHVLADVVAWLEAQRAAGVAVIEARPGGSSPPWV